MGIVFFETMRGDVRDASGVYHLVDFDLRVEAGSLRWLLGKGEARLTGIVNAAPWADRAAVAGTLTFAPLLGRYLAYEIRFDGTDGRSYRLNGRKDLNWLAPVSSMTVMATELVGPDGVVARGTMRFDLNDLVSFIASVQPSETTRKLRMHAVDGSDVVTAREASWMRALGDAAIVAGVHVPAVDDESIARACSQLAQFPPEALAGWRAALASVAAAVAARTGKPLAAADRGAVARCLRDWLRPGDGSVLRALVDFTLMPIRAGHFGRPDYLKAISYPAMTNRVSEPPPRYLEAVTNAEELAGYTTIEAEVVVIGTGAGGGAVAASLAERGVAVALVEEGRYHTRRDFSGGPTERMSSLYRESGMTFTVGNPPISIPMGKLVGGTTAINSGTCFRTPDRVLEQWRTDFGLPSDFDPAQFDPYFAKVERELGVAPNDMRYLGQVAEVVAAGAGEMGLDHAPLPRNAPGCDGQGACIFGCPTAAKRSSNVSWVPRAIRAGASVFCGLPVRRVLMRGRHAVGIEARGPDRFGVEKTLRIRADAVVVSCGTLLSPLLLADSGIRSPWLGRNLSVHPGMGMMGMTDKQAAPWQAVPQGYGVHGVGEGIVFEGVYLPPPFLVTAMPLIGHELTRWMDRHNQVVQFGFMIRDEGNGRVRRGPGGRRLVTYSLSDRSHHRLLKGSAILAEMLLRGGAKEVMTGLAPIPIVRTVDEARALTSAPLGKGDWKLLGAHPLGTCRVAGDAADGVIDPDHRVFGTSNLYVVDGSAVPSSLGVNPQVTIMSMALRAGERLADRLKRGAAHRVSSAPTAYAMRN